MARSCGRGDADERNAGGTCGARVIHRVAQIPDLAMRDLRADFVQTLGMRLGVRHMIHADYGVKNFLTEAIERDLRFPAEAAGKNGEGVVRGEAVEQSFACEPAFAQDQSIMVVAEKNLLKARDHVVEIDLF